jgi:lipopolysaccharide biosynthesis protein
MGTIWPRPQTFHLPATTANLTELALLAQKCQAMQIAVHLHAYAQDRVLLEWYDAFWKVPFYLSGAITEDRVRAFSSALELSYKKAKQNVEEH